jgi:hypothetical protein
VVHLEAEKITREAMIAPFETLAACHPSATAINVVLDNASYNRSAAVKAYVSSEGCRVRLVFPPPRSPNLNLIERLWWFLKKIALWNEYYPTFAGFKAAIDGFFRDPGNCRDQRTSLITDHFSSVFAPESQPPVQPATNGSTASPRCRWQDGRSPSAAYPATIKGIGLSRRHCVSKVHAAFFPNMWLGP